MSWEGFKKGLNRAGTTILQKTGAVDKTIDPDFETEERRLKTLGSKMDTLHKEAKGYLDSLRAVSLGQEMLASNIEALLPEGSEGRPLARRFGDTAKACGGAGRQQFEEAYRATVLESITRYATLFSAGEDYCKKRSSKLLDFDAARSKLRKALDRPNNDPEKLPKLEAEEAHCREIYEKINQVILHGIPRLVEQKNPLIKPSLEAFERLQARWYEECDRQMDNLPQIKTTTINVDLILEDLHHLPIFTI